jgi:peptidoglycan/xylan/chitin deacetylase (PgdA/CDA1 family)
MRVGMVSIKTTFVRAAKAVTACLPLSLLERLSGGRACVVLYHAVADRTPAHLKHLLPCRDVASFRRDLDFFLQRFEPISLEQLIDGAARGASLPRNSFHLTCDDGLREAAEVIAPICREKGVPATFLVTTGFLDNRWLWQRHLGSLLLDRVEQTSEERREQLWKEFCPATPSPTAPRWRDLLISHDTELRPRLDALAEALGFGQAAYLRDVRPYFDSADVERLLRDGFTIGAHTDRHPYFPAIAAEQQVCEAVDSLRQLESAFGIVCRTFAFPFGADGVGPEFYKTVQANHPVDLFFGVGTGSVPSADGCLDRIPFDFGADFSTDRVLRRIYVERIQRQLRGEGRMTAAERERT